jgi:hypothetical protein
MARSFADRFLRLKVLSACMAALRSLKRQIACNSTGLREEV